MLSVCMATCCGRENLLLDCLKSLEQQDFQDFEVCLTDNGPKRTKLGLSEFPFTIQYTFRPVDYYALASGRNLAIAKARGSLVLFTNDDIFFHPFALGIHWQMHQSNPNHTIVGQCLRIQDGGFKSGTDDWIRTIEGAFETIEPRRRAFRLGSFSYMRIQNADDSVPKEALRTLLEKTGRIFDEGFDHYYSAEDHEFGYRLMHVAKCRPLPADGILAYHPPHTRPAVHVARGGHHRRNLLYAYEKIIETQQEFRLSEETLDPIRRAVIDEGLL